MTNSKKGLAQSRNVRKEERHQPHPPGDTGLMDEDGNTNDAT
jgi:hypothetical protein